MRKGLRMNLNSQIVFGSFGGEIRLDYPGNSIRSTEFLLSLRFIGGRCSLCSVRFNHSLPRWCAFLQWKNGLSWSTFFYVLMLPDLESGHRIVYRVQVHFSLWRFVPISSKRAHPTAWFCFWSGDIKLECLTRGRRFEEQHVSNSSVPSLKRIIKWGWKSCDTPSWTTWWRWAIMLILFFIPSKLICYKRCHITVEARIIVF